LAIPYLVCLVTSGEAIDFHSVPKELCIKLYLAGVIYELFTKPKPL
jgi:hypothetical protein